MPSASRTKRKFSGKITVKNTGGNASVCNYDNKLQSIEHKIASLSSTITKLIASRDNFDLISSFMSDLYALITSMNDKILTLMNARNIELKEVLLARLESQKLNYSKVQMEYN